MNLATPLLAPLLAAVLAFGAANAPAAPVLAPQPCPPGVAAGTQCLLGRDAQGAFVLTALPKDWNGLLVVHAHGGPELGAPSARRALADLERWAVWTRAGFAWAGSSFRQGGVAVRAAAEDTERARTIFLAEVARPRRTLLHGQSWGAGVAAIAAETFTAPAGGQPPSDAVLLTSGVLGGGSLSYDVRLDLRVVYQALCGNHPRSDEPAYPLWQGLPPDSRLTRAELAARVDECTGLRHPVAERSPEQQRRLKTLLDVTRVPERQLQGHLNWGTWHFQDIVFKRLGGGNPFGNARVRYRGSDDDEALNAKVLRYSAEPAARAAFAADTDPSGRIGVPVLTLHAIDDPVAFVELESSFRDTMARAGAGERLVQVFSADREHSYLADAEYLAAMQALLAWVERGEKPTPASVSERCARLDAALQPATACRFRPDYRPAPLADRVPAR